MKTKNLFFVFLVAVVLASSFVMAAEIASDISVEANDNLVGSKTIGITAGKTLDLSVSFTSVTNEKDVTVKAWIDGYRDEIEQETERFDVSANRTYTEKLSLAIPGDLNISDDFKLIVRIASKNKEDQQRYQLTIQRPSYDIEILSTEFVREVKDGDNLQVNVVVKNRGSHKVEDTYIKARISELGIEKKVYAGDLVSVDCEENCDKEDAVEKTLVLEIPKGTKSGKYAMTIEAYNDDSSSTVTQDVTVKGAEAAGKVEVLTPQLTKEVQVGSKEIYRIEIVNPTSETKVITISTPAALEKAGVKITSNPSVVTIPANSAESVEITVEATNQTTAGSYTVPITVGSDGETKEIGITANVVKVKAQPTGLSRPLFTLAIVLGILFVVLVAVLFTTMKKPEKLGEEETTYY